MHACRSRVRVLTRSALVVLSAVIGLIAAGVAVHVSAAAAEGLTLAREQNWLILRSPRLPGGEVRINYLEAYCRAGSTAADWIKHTVIPHTSEVIAAEPRTLKIRDRVADGLVVDHLITAGDDEIDFQLTATNPTATRSEAHWAQACPRLAAFTGVDPQSRDIEDYVPKCFLFLDGQLARMPTRDWMKQARYMPGQVWCPAHVPRTDVNPRPLNPHVPSNGLIGVFSGDDALVFATAWEPYQELFQGVARCVHADFRLGGLAAGETKKIRGKIYVVPANIPALLSRYEKDFPEHRPAK
jgi:hypothetical protein